MKRNDSPDPVALYLLVTAKPCVSSTPMNIMVVNNRAFNRDDLDEYLSLEHRHVNESRISVRKGNELATNPRRPILGFEEYTSHGIHEIRFVACDEHRYKREAGHDLQQSHHVALRWLCLGDQSK